MISKFQFTRETSIKNEVVPFLKKNLEQTGVALIHQESELCGSDLEKQLLVLTVLSGQKLSSDFAYYSFEGQGTDVWLPAHVENIYAIDGIIPYFALGCVSSAYSGGDTRIFDSRKAAKILEKEYPTLMKTKIRYGSQAHPTQSAIYKLVEKDKKYGNVLRYRAQVFTNFVEEVGDAHYEIADVYKITDEILERSVIDQHAWKEGGDPLCE